MAPTLIELAGVDPGVTKVGDRTVRPITGKSWEMFDIARDPGERRDLSLVDPTRKAALAAAWGCYAQRVGVILPDAIPYRP